MFKDNSSFNVLYTTSVEQTYSFFNALHVEIKQKEHDKVVVSFGSFELHYILHTSEPFEAYNYITHPEKYGQGIIFYVETEDIEAAKEMIEKAGGILKTPVFDNLWNAKELLFEDPNGYKFALYQ